MGEHRRDADATLFDAAVGEVNGAVGELGDFGVVGDQEDGLAAGFVEGQEDVEDGTAGLGVEVSGGLVGEEEGGIVDEGAGDGDALAFAAGELGGTVLEAMGKAEGFEERECFGFSRAGANEGLPDGGFNHGGEERVFENIEFREQVVKLEDKTDVEIPQLVAFPEMHAGDALAAEEDVAHVGSFEGTGDVEQGGFSGARRAHDGDELAVVDLHIDAAENVHGFRPHGVGLVDVLEFQQRRLATHTAPPSPDLRDPQRWRGWRRPTRRRSWPAGSKPQLPGN